MEPLRLAQRRVLREVFRELSATSSRQAIRQQRRLLHGHAPSQRPSNTAFSNTTRSPIQSRIRSLQHTSRARPQQHSSNPFTQRPFRRHASTSTSSNPSAEGSLSLSQRLKKLTREYGWSALGVYLALSALDFPFCFLGVRTLGTERIGYLEHEALSFLKMVVQWPMAKMGWEWGESEIEKGSKEVKQGLKEMEIPVGEPEKQGPRLLDDQPDSGTKYGEAHGVEEAEKANKGEGASRSLAWYASLQ